jgi:hypothetical protein
MHLISKHHPQIYKLVLLKFFNVVWMPKKENNAPPKVKPASAVLKFIASLFFIYVLYMGLSSGGWAAVIKLSVWISIVFSIALLSTIALFVTSIGGMAMPKRCNSGTSKLVTVAALTVLILASLSWNVAWITITVLGFLIGWLGEAAMM